MTHETLPAETAVARRAPLMAGGRPAAIIPQTMDDAYRLGKAICMAGMAPKGMDSPEKCMIAIMRGMEVGLTPMQALDKIAIVNGRPTIWGDGALGLVRGSGLCEWVDETLEGDGDARVATCRVKRKGEPRPTVRTFSVADAKTAKLWNKKGRDGQDTPWVTMPDRMLRMRARAFALRDGFADVLGGLYLKEELDDGPVDRQEQSRRVAPSASAPMIEHQPEPEQQAPDVRQAEPAPQATEKPAEPRRAPSASAQPAKQEKPPADAAYDPEKVRARFAEALKTCKSVDDINQAWMQIVDPIQDDMFPSDREDLEIMVRRRTGEIAGDTEWSE